MKKINVIYGCLVFVLLVSMCSCGARKVNKQHAKEETKSEIVDNSVVEKQTDTNVKTTTIVKVDDKNETVTEETIMEPSDNTKESFVIEKDGTKVVLNNIKKTARKTTQKNNTQSQLSGNSEQVAKETVKEQKSVNNTITSKKENSVKNLDRKAIPWYYFVIGFSVLVLFFYFFGKRYKFI
jgi:ABC-type Na+ efflux pump permease subunit